MIVEKVVQGVATPALRQDIGSARINIEACVDADNMGNQNRIGVGTFCSSIDFILQQARLQARFCIPGYGRYVSGFQVSSNEFFESAPGSGIADYADDQQSLVFLTGPGGIVIELYDFGSLYLHLMIMRDQAEDFTAVAAIA